MEKEDILYLSLINKIGPKTIFKLVENYTQVESLLVELKKGNPQLGFLNQEQKKALLDESVKRHQHNIIKYLAHEKVDFVTYWDKKYPDILKQIGDPPAGLFIRGEITNEDKFSLAFVGTRNCDTYGRTITEKLCQSTASLGISIVSGLAKGIDTVAHISALKMKSRTIAVLGTSIDNVYPGENRRLAYKIRDNGAVISEFAPGIKTVPANFVRRNRIISGLCRAVIVTQAGAGSGALTTAINAVEQNREVFAVPGSVETKMHEGCHYLIKQGAKLVESFDDIIQEFQLLQDRQNPQMSWINEDVKELTYSKNEKILMDCLQKDMLHIDTIQHSCGLKLPNILSSLMNLELKGYVKQYPGKIFKRIV